MTSTTPAVNGPGFPIPRPPASPWREDALTRITELETLTAWIKDHPEATAPPALVTATCGHLEAARDEALRRSGLVRWVKGVSIERTMTNIDAAEADLLQIAPLGYVKGQLPSLQAHVRKHLVVEDPRRLALEAIAAKERDAAEGDHGVTEEERIFLVAAFHGASSAGRREEMRLRSFRNVLYVATGLLLLIATGLGVLGAFSPSTLPLCFTPGGGNNARVVCPLGETFRGDEEARVVVEDTVSSGDLLVVMLLGAVAAAVAAAAGLRKVRGTSTPYDLPVALAFLKLPTGAVTAVLGLLLMRGGFVPGLSNLDTSAQILAWAVVFGYAQQVFTRMVDDRAQEVLESVGTPTETAGDDATTA